MTGPPWFGLPNPVLINISLYVRHPHQSLTFDHMQITTLDLDKYNNPECVFFVLFFLQYCIAFFFSWFNRLLNLIAVTSISTLLI